MGREVAFDAVKRVDEKPPEHRHRIRPPGQRRRPRVRLLSRDRHVEPAGALHAGHHTDLAPALLENRALLDVQLESGGERAAPDGERAAVADAVDGVGDRDPVRVRRAECVRERKAAGEGARAHHGGRKAGALLVRPVHHFDR